MLQWSIQSLLGIVEKKVGAKLVKLYCTRKGREESEVGEQTCRDSLVLPQEPFDLLHDGLGILIVVVVIVWHGNAGGGVECEKEEEVKPGLGTSHIFHARHRIRLTFSSLLSVQHSRLALHGSDRSALSHYRRRHPLRYCIRSNLSHAASVR